MNVNRRQALQITGTGIAALAGAGSFWAYFNRLKSNAEPADVFKGDSPNDQVFALWKKRGWVKEAAHYLQLGKNVQCKVCPNNCLLAPGDRSHCRNKINRDGTLYTMAYANPCTFHVDPIEKKPLFHFHPGTTSFSLATSGCVFRCLNCQNWEISQKKPEELKDPSGEELRLKAPLPTSISLRDFYRLSLFPKDLPGVASSLGCPSISYTYSEPTAYFEYAFDCCQEARAAGLKNVLVTCGSIEERPLIDIARFVDAAHVDLKGFDEDIYRRLNTGKLQPILNTLKTYHQLGIWFEVIHLIVPSYTDNAEIFKRMCGWLVENLGPDRPLHISRFMPQHKLTHLPPTPLGKLMEARQIARSAGLRYVYVGNAPEIVDGETTFCPGCKKPLIQREMFSITRFEIKDGKCRHCQTPIAGIWG